MELSPYVAPFTSLGKARSAGITDLRYGSITAREDEFVPLPDDVECYALAATLGKRRDLLADRLVGDGLVPLDSALGKHPDSARTLAVPKTRQWIGYEMGHLELLGRPEVYSQLEKWLRRDVDQRDTPMLPETMRYVAATAAGGPEVLAIGTTAVPQPKADEVLIRVQAAGVNRPDVAQRKGLYPAPPGASPIIGLEVAGEVVARGSEAHGFAHRRPCMRVDERRRLRRVLRRAGHAVPALAAGLRRRPRRGAARNVLHGLGQPVHPRPPGTRRDGAGARRQQRHRRHCHPARARVRRACLCHRRQRREVRSVRAPRRRRSDQLPDGGLRRAHRRADRWPRCRRRHRHRRGALLRAQPASAWRWTAGWSKSRPREACVSKASTCSTSCGVG